MLASPINSVHRERFDRASTFLLGALCIALIGIPATYYATRQSNTALVIQQLKLTQVQNFEQSGARVDSAVSQFSVALKDRKGIESSRRSVWSAVADHSSATFSMRDSIGDTYYPSYMENLNQIGAMADNASTPQGGVAVWQSLADLIARRKKISDRVKMEATS